MRCGQDVLLFRRREEGETACWCGHSHSIQTKMQIIHNPILAKISSGINGHFHRIGGLFADFLGFPLSKHQILYENTIFSIDLYDFCIKKGTDILYE